MPSTLVCFDSLILLPAAFASHSIISHECCRAVRLNSPIVIEYTLTERALPGSLRVQLRCAYKLAIGNSAVCRITSGFDIIWLRSLAPVPGIPSPKALRVRRRREAPVSARQADPQSPHSFVVYPAKEQSGILSTTCLCPQHRLDPCMEGAVEHRWDIVQHLEAEDVCVARAC